MGEARRRKLEARLLEAGRQKTRAREALIDVQDRLEEAEKKVEDSYEKFFSLVLGGNETKALMASPQVEQLVDSVFVRHRMLDGTGDWVEGVHAPAVQKLTEKIKTFLTAGQDHFGIDEWQEYFTKNVKGNEVNLVDEISKRMAYRALEDRQFIVKSEVLNLLSGDVQRRVAEEIKAWDKKRGEEELAAYIHDEGKKGKSEKKALTDLVQPVMKSFIQDHSANLGSIWSDQELTTSGMKSWEKTYKKGLSDEDVLKFSLEAAAVWGEEQIERGVKINESRIAVFGTILCFTAKWAVHAFQRIVTTHTFASALMCSDADKSQLEDIEMQWHAFMVVVPNGLLKFHDDDRGTDTDYSRILVASYDDRAVLILLSRDSAASSHRIVIQLSSSIATLLDVGIPVESVSTADELAMKTSNKVSRIIILAKRLVAGFLLTLQHRDNFTTKKVAARQARSPREHDEPEHRIVTIGRPLSIDCRPMIADFIKSGTSKRRGGGAPSVQTLVRGHYKRQVVGIGRMGRKVIFIQPFWRGPEDAPILTKPKKLGG